MKVFEVECVRVSPMLMNPMTDEMLESLRTRVRLPVRTDITRQEEAERKIYREDGKIGIPSQNLFSCLVEAGRRVQVEKRRNISTAESTTLPSFLSIREFFLPLSDGNGGEPKWVVDARRGRNPADGVAVCIVRPRFDLWGFRFTIEVDESQISPEKVRRLIEIAGSAIGLGDFRPGCKGQFGRFRIVKWEENGHPKA